MSKVRTWLTDLHIYKCTWTIRTAQSGRRIRVDNVRRAHWNIALDEVTASCKTKVRERHSHQSPPNPCRCVHHDKIYSDIHACMHSAKPFDTSCTAYDGWFPRICTHANTASDVAILENSLYPSSSAVPFAWYPSVLHGGERNNACMQSKKLTSACIYIANSLRACLPCFVLPVMIALTGSSESCQYDDDNRDWNVMRHCQRVFEFSNGVIVDGVFCTYNHSTFPV